MKSGATIKASVVIVPFNQKDLVRKTLESLEAQTVPPKEFEVILVDESVDGTKEMVESFRQHSRLGIRYIRASHSGVDAKRNTGFKKAIAPIVCFTDHDVIVQPDWIEQVLQSFKENPAAVGVEGLIRTDQPRPLFSNAPENLQGKQYLTANLSFRKWVLEKTGGNSEKYFFFREDAEMAFRCMRWGDIVFCPKAVVYHPPVSLPWRSMLPNRKRLDQFVRNEIRLSKQFPALYRKTFGSVWNAYKKDFLYSIAVTGLLVAMAAAWWAFQLPWILFPIAYVAIAGSVFLIALRKRKDSLREKIVFSTVMTAKHLVLGWWMAYYLIKHSWNLRNEPSEE